MNEIIESIKPVIKNLRYVKINEKAIENFTRTVDQAEFGNSEIKFGIKGSERMTEEEYIAYAFVLGALQFCFWGEPKWTIDCDDGRKLDGSAALVHSLQKSVEKGLPLLKAEYLAHLGSQDLEDVLRGEPQIPLFSERLNILHDLGRITLEKFEGRFDQIVMRAQGNSVNIVRNIVKEFPTVFDDSIMYRGSIVYFLKRAQIVPLYLFDLCNKGLIKIPITGRENLTGLADYKVPQMLRDFGILEYVSSLAEKVDNKIEISKGSDEEIEIRACTIEAGDLAKNLLKPRFPEMSSALVHKILWHRSQDKTKQIKPYHRTRTIWY